MKNKKISKSRNYVFTINNYTKKHLKQLEEIAKKLERHSYICFGLEVAPTTKTKHIQGYIELKDNQAFTFLHNYFSLKKKDKILKFHVEVAKGTQKQNYKYTSKEGKFFEFGEPKKQGLRTDMREIKKLIKENPSNLKKIIDENANNLQQLKYAESLVTHYFEHRDENNPPKVFWLFGSSGCGKTKMVYDSFGSENICKVSLYNWLGTDYRQQECFLLDDFREDSLKFEELLSITDRYPYTLNYKNGSIPLNSPFIVITTPKNIEDTYVFLNEDLKQIKRRVIEIDIDLYSSINLKTITNKEINKVKFNYTLQDDKNGYNNDIKNPFN